MGILVLDLSGSVVLHYSVKHGGGIQTKSHQPTTTAPRVIKNSNLTAGGDSKLHNRVLYEDSLYKSYNQHVHLTQQTSFWIFKIKNSEDEPGPPIASANGVPTLPTELNDAPPVFICDQTIAADDGKSFTELYLLMVGSITSGRVVVLLGSKANSEGVDRF